ncbi:hypothetical protein GCM10023320_84260 [Pseudonocardia adelaidensis]|uniref:Uncharacterized protein n=1 Tax=Pseudonocardia adelaidensis TaxID=648754 RepID=A0ABP9PA70_9PSEU
MSARAPRIQDGPNQHFWGYTPNQIAEPGRLHLNRRTLLTIKYSQDRKLAPSITKLSHQTLDITLPRNRVLNGDKWQNFLINATQKSATKERGVVVFNDKKNTRAWVCRARASADHEVGS